MLEHLIGLGADPNEVDGRGYSVLLCAVEARRADAVEVLLAHGADHQFSHGGLSLPGIARANRDVRIIALLAAASMRSRVVPQDGPANE